LAVEIKTTPEIMSRWNECVWQLQRYDV